MPDKKLRLLIADDHKMFIEGLQLMLKHQLQMEIAGHALNGKDAIEMCSRLEVDAVIMDVHMPTINGVEATRIIKKLYPYIKVIIVSSEDNINIVSDALKAGADAFVLKEAGCSELSKAFRSINRNEIYISETIAHFFGNNNNTCLKGEKNLGHKENFITLREQEVLKLISEGYTNKQIAKTLYIAVSTADTHRKNLLSKLKLPNTAALIRFAVENKLVQCYF